MHKPMRLPPLKVLRVKYPNKLGEKPCTSVMSSVLACWASTGYASPNCTSIEQALRACMEGPQDVKVQKSSINYHLSRFQKYIEGPSKKRSKK